MKKLSDSNGLKALAQSLFRGHVSREDLHHMVEECPRLVHFLRENLEPSRVLPIGELYERADRYWIDIAALERAFR